MRKIAGVCDMHRVPFGSPEALPGFLSALDEDKHLAMDFWAVMGKMGDESSAYLAGRTLNARMLEVVVEAVTGCGVAEIVASGEESRRVVEQLVRLLAGEDLNSPVVVDDLPEAPDVEVRKPVTRAEPSSLASGPASSGVGSPPPLRLFRSGTDEPDRSLVELHPLHLADEGVSSSAGRCGEWG